MDKEKDSFEVDGIKLDPDNTEFQIALQFVLESNKNLYLTGKAGSGKTTFLRYLRKVSNKKMAIVAPTGVAAINAGGQTIHSFFKIEPSIYVPGDKRLRAKAQSGDRDSSTIYDAFSYTHDRINIMRGLELLVIDEVSMVRADLLDVVDTLLRTYRGNQLPFGGVQVVLIGDTFQLPPVLNAEDREVFYRFYESEYFFSAKVIQQSKPIYIELKKIYRQNEKDFIELLNRVRVGKMIQDDYRVLNSRLNTGYQPNEQDKYIILATTNDKVSTINEKKLDSLQSHKMTYAADVEGDFPFKSRPTDTNLCLKVGSQVMFVKNNWDKKYYNGEIGIITKLDNNKIMVEVNEPHGLRRTITVLKEQWQNKKYSWDDKKKTIIEEVIGTFSQFPIRLAWAITVHKSQGLTFEKVIADIGSTFAPGQAYVALSRCTSMNGLVLTSRIQPGSIITDPRVLEFAKNETPETLLTEQLSGSRADYYYREARKAFRGRNVNKMIDSFYTAIKYRNDIETDTLRRFVTLWSKRLFNYILLCEELQASIIKKNHDIQDYIEQVSILKNTVSLNKKIIAAKTASLSEKDDRISALEKEIEELQKRLRKEKAALNRAQKKSQTDEETIITLERKIKSQDGVMADRQKTIADLNAELERVRNIKWYEKLFGVK